MLFYSSSKKFWYLFATHSSPSHSKNSRRNIDANFQPLFVPTGVVDPVSEKTLTVTEATHGGILDGHSTTYKTETGEHISIHDAIASGLVHVEYHEDPNAKPEIVTKTYAVHGVVDQRRKDKVRRRRGRKIEVKEGMVLGLDLLRDGLPK